MSGSTLRRRGGRQHRNKNKSHFDPVTSNNAKGKENGYTSYLFVVLIFFGVYSFHTFWPSGSISNESLINPGDFTANKFINESEKKSSFLHWFTKMGGASRKVGLDVFPKMGWGIRAEQQIEQGDAVLEIPLSLVLCQETILRESEKEDVEFWKKIERDDLKLSAFLMLQKLKATKNSKWQPYIAMLPENISRAVDFSEKELNLFQDKLLSEVVMLEKRKRNQDYASIKPVLLKLGIEDTLISKDLFYWATSVVSSRALSIQGRRYLAPFADMFNGEPHPIQRQHDNGNFFLAHHVLTNKKLSIMADRNCSKRQQLYEDYGDNDNSIFVQYHGFAIENNPFDCIKIQLPSIKEVLSSFKDQKLLIQQTLRFPDSPIACIDRRGRIREKMAEYYLQLLTMDEAETLLCENSLPKSGLLSQWKPFSCFQEQEHLTHLQKANRSKFLLKLVRNHLHSFETDLVYDIRYLMFNEPVLSSHEKLALNYRIEMKKVCRDLVKELSAMDAFESYSTNNNMGRDEAGHATAINAFNKWIEKEFPLNKLRVGTVSGMRFGTYASEQIQNNEMYLSVPKKFVLDQQSARSCIVIGKVINDLVLKHGSGDAFHELLLHVMYEKFVKANTSFWFPYFQLIPDVNELDVPLVYSEAEMQLLMGTDLLVNIELYQQRVFGSFQSIKRAVIAKYPDIFSTSVFNFLNYRWAFAILDSRSIWWSGQRHLVPLLDMINCDEGPDPERVHSTEFDNVSQTAITKAKWDFEKGEQVFENYGQPNHIYLSFHGFVLEKNNNDCAHFIVPYDSLGHLDSNRKREVVSRKLFDLGIRGESPEFCINPKSIQPHMLEAIWEIYAIDEENNDSKTRQLFAYEKLIQISNRRQQALKTKSKPALDGLNDERFRFRMISLYCRQQLKLFEELEAVSKRQIIKLKGKP